ncbi:nicotinate-nucleotide adenylyltransferase [Acetitomaculum ruminis DSM 5522]|uniref:Probable nicotinate-nucleotide adenylyltransferase n=1 Tax=Acetitomaculum ruminis DSM 5522 TaxID=1120918 RepID=A0A1I0V6E3_9FIRM|nr:nicotinate-nucleotide adenylyltransferase [Acetitomaculum ruminis]SFA71848.1 nicotinate-nucleotide adenylyltransferase [Acetitomaculum ruminis DSM 5522]
MNGEVEEKIGILGGTFNPIHLGHMLIAENAYDQFHLDKVIFLPSGNPPHKKNIGYISAKDRANMVSLSIKNRKEFELSYEEIDREGTTYTSDTMERMTKEHPNVRYYFILGADSLFTFDKWHRPDIICKCCTILVSCREELKLRAVDERIKYLKEKFNADVHRLTLPGFDVSSKLIRMRVGLNRSIKYLVNEDVEEYIKKQHLYENIDLNTLEPNSYEIEYRG